MLELEEALQRVLAAIPAPVAEAVSIAEADGRVLAQPVFASIDLPPFDNSAMDGYAVRSADISEAGASTPVRLCLAGKVAAGGNFSGVVRDGQCVRLFTGSPIPSGADAVVMQEDTEGDPNNPGAVLFREPATPGENVRRRGEDVPRGQRIFEAGERLGPAQISLLAAIGIGQVNLGRAPKVALLATGSELVAPGAGSGTLEPGQIYESNGVGLAALTRRAGCQPQILPPVPDDLPTTRRAIEAALGSCDILVTAGGVSVGELDFVKQAFTELGGELQFWKVAVKPGRPFVFGRWRDRFLFGLPGNPVSALITYLLLVRPALLRFQGARMVELPATPGRLGEPFNNPGDRRHFLRVRLDANGLVRSAGTQASHMLSSLAAANGLVDIPSRTSWPAGTAVSVLRWGSE